MGINVQQLDRHHDTGRRRDEHPEKPGPGRRSREQPRRETFRSRREDLPGPKQQERNRGRCRHRYRRGAIQQGSPVQVAQDAHRSGHRHQYPQAPGQVPEKLSSLPSPLSKKERRENSSREKQECRRQGGHAAGGDRTHHRRMGKQPFFQGKDGDSQSFHELDQPVRRKERGQHGCEYARRTLQGSHRTNQEQPPEAEETDRGEGSHRDIGGSDAREEGHSKDPAQQTKESQRGGGRSKERCMFGDCIRDRTNGPACCGKSQVILLSPRNDCHRCAIRFRNSVILS